MEMPPALAVTGSPSTTSKWFEFMREAREAREASDRRLERMFERMNVRDKPRDDINKAIPQVQSMKDSADLMREYFQLFEVYSARSKNAKGSLCRQAH
jgi:hypothetical protein